MRKMLSKCSLLLFCNRVDWLGDLINIDKDHVLLYYFMQGELLR